MSTLNGISYVELNADSGQLDIQKSTTGQRAFKVAWNQRIMFAASLVGYTQIVGDQIICVGCQTYPGIGNMYCTGAKITPIGKPVAENTWVSAKIVAHYECLTWNPTQPSEMYEEKLRTSYEILDVSDDTTRAYSGPDASSYNCKPPVQIVIPKVEYDLTLHRQPVVPFAAVTAFMGGGTNQKPKVNSTTFRGAAPGHLLFLGCDADGKANTWGYESWDITYKFLWSPFDHRMDYDATTDQWVQTLHAVTNQPKYDNAEFHQLFSVPLAGF